MPEPVDLINLGFLSESEQDLILEVLRRDEELRQAEEHRVRKLKSDLLDAKRKGAKRGSGRYSAHSCGRCQEPLSRMTLFSSKCSMCKHDVCVNCRTVLPEGSWLCSVCAKESDLKKTSGDWFFDQRVNRFCTAPGHDLVKVSLKRKPLSKKRETAGELLLKNTEMLPNPPTPMPRIKQRNLKEQICENSGSIASRDSFESREGVRSKSTCSDTESAEISSIISSKADPASVTPDHPRSDNDSVRSGSTVSSFTTPVKVDVVSMDSADSTNKEANAPSVVKRVSPSPDPEVDKLFKKSVKRKPNAPEFVSTMDLRDEPPEAPMGTRSRSVPGLDVQEDGEEEEDIDSLVNFHKKTMVGSSTNSLRGSKSTLGSTMSIYSEAGDFDSVDVSGEVVFSVSYDQHTQSLQVFIKECRELACGNASRHTSNPYVKCYLLPDKSRLSKKKTGYKRNTVNPVYKETLKYSISRSQVLTRSLLISVWHHGRLSRNAFLGEVEVPLDCRDLDSPYEDTATLLPKAGSAIPTSAFAHYKGDLVISLKYVTPKTPTEKKGKKAAAEGGELHVLIKEAKNLVAMKPGDTSDSFVKGNLFPTKSTNTRRKTAVVKKNLNPHYDHTFIYKELALEQLGQMCLELTVWDKESLLHNEFLGGVRVSSGKGAVNKGKGEVEMDSVGEEVSLWEKMMQYPDSWAEGTLPLRSTMEKAK